ncbi:hypothetical protein [Paraburkholderia bryophila]|uniref:Uncharacterized protein n=1 Tax=Paraburkholderia bryophila TaxID=420952 RepID=A0A7Y9WX93_9BURK|nr:hypothetical protein [Paraburkholderia bryophila]NYH27623.1 hypothetical protein [Paraburkholderia bryophila]
MESNDSQESSEASSAQFQSHETEQRQSITSGPTFAPGFGPILANATDTGGVLGFAVVKKTPWHFGGIYAQENEAQRVAANLGSDYEVEYGLHRFDSDDSYY